MKKIFTLMIAIVASIAVIAYPNATRLTISTVTNQSVTIVIDNRPYQVRANDNSYTINDVSAGYHSIKIYRQANNGRRRNNGQMIYSGNIYVKRGYHTDITINRFGKAFVDEQAIGSGYREEDNDWNDDKYDNYAQPMNSRSFEQLKQAIANEPFDNTKLTMAKTNIAVNLFSAVQAKQIIQLFSFEASKLDIAKYLYKYTTDKNNYFTVYDAFAYSSSKEELSRYIQQYR